jgi:hypothetical protein
LKIAIVLIRRSIAKRSIKKKKGRGFVGDSFRPDSHYSNNLEKFRKANDAERDSPFVGRIGRSNWDLEEEISDFQCCVLNLSN